jgi:hypothetical protein
VPWLTLVLLGAFHGVNPAMGWLFAVAAGLQERRLAAVLSALLPIAVGHEASVGVVAVVVELTRSLAAQRVVAACGATVLVAFGIWRLFSTRHFRWVGMRLNRRELALWSFLMSSAHGAGLMLVPVLVHEGGALGTGPGELLAHGGAAGSVVRGLLAAAVHSGAMLVVMATVAVVVYEVVGVEMLRRAWFNLDRVWALALIGAGTVTLFS